METDILDSLNDIGYEGPLSDEAAFTAALAAGPKSLELTKLVHILAAELKELLSLEETVSMMSSPDESNTFLMELSSFLKELGCPYTKLVTGHMSSRLQCTEDCILLLEYLVSELMAARMVRHDRPQTGPNMEIVVQESPTARDLKNILISLKFNKPPPGITAEVLFAKLETKLKDTIQKEGDNLVGKPLYNKALTEKQWRELETAFAEMSKEYKLRRETLITRLECTIRSFEWSDRLKCKKDAILSVSRPAISSLSPRPGVTLSQLLAARSSMLEDKRKKDAESHVRGIVIGPVPDRGGRPSEAQPPPPEMPSWQQRTPGQQGGGRGGPRGGRGGGGRGGGGRVQGGYNQGGGGGGESRPQSNSSGYQQQNNQRFQSYQTYEVPPGGYQNQTTGYNHNRGGYQQGGGGGGGYNQNQDNGYQGGYNKNQGGGYQGGYNQSQGGYSQRGGGYNQGYGSGGGGGGGYQGGYQNEHDDRDRPTRGRSNYNRGGRR